MEAIALAILIFIAVAVQTTVYQKKFFKKLFYTCDFSTHRARVGDKVQLTETVSNKKLLPIPWLRVSIFSSKWLEYANNLSTVIDETRYVSSIFYTGGRKKVKRTWNMECKKRGLFEINNITLIGGDPLGVATVSVPAKVNTSILVYPDSVDIDQGLIPLNIMQGDTIVKRWIADDPFLVAGVRDYTPTDTMNRIHMNASARMGNLMVKKCDFTSSLTLTVILNMQSIENENNEIVDKVAIENGIRISAGFFDTALSQGIPFRFVTNGVTSDDPENYVFSETKAGSTQHESLLEILAKLQMKYQTHFDRFLNRIYQNINDSEVMVITAYVDDALGMNLQKLMSRGNNVKLILLDYSADTTKVPDGVTMYVYRKAGNREVVA